MFQLYTEEFSGYPVTNPDYFEKDELAMDGRYINVVVRDSQGTITPDNGNNVLKNIIEPEEAEMFIPFGINDDKYERIAVVYRADTDADYTWALNDAASLRKYAELSGKNFDEVFSECICYTPEPYNVQFGILLKSGRVTFLSPDDAVNEFERFMETYYKGVSEEAFIEREEMIYITVDKEKRYTDRNYTKDDMRIKFNENIDLNMSFHRIEDIETFPFEEYKKGALEIGISTKTLRMYLLTLFRKHYVDKIEIIEYVPYANDCYYLDRLDTDRMYILCLDFQGWKYRSVINKIAKLSENKMIFVTNTTGESLNGCFEYFMPLRICEHLNE